MGTRLQWTEPLIMMPPIRNTQAAKVHSEDINQKLGHEAEREEYNR